MLDRLGQLITKLWQGDEEDEEGSADGKENLGGETAVRGAEVGTGGF